MTRRCYGWTGFVSTLDSRLPAAALEEGVMEAPPMTESFKDLNKTYTNLTQPSFRGFCRQFIKSRAKAKQPVTNHNKMWNVDSGHYGVQFLKNIHCNKIVVGCSEVRR